MCYDLACINHLQWLLKISALTQSPVPFTSHCACSRLPDHRVQRCALPAHLPQGLCAARGCRGSRQWRRGPGGPGFHRGAVGRGSQVPGQRRSCVREPDSPGAEHMRCSSTPACGGGRAQVGGGWAR